MGKVYLIVSAVSTFVRQFLLTNPFAVLGFIPSLLLNYLISAPLHLFSYSQTGIYVEGGCGAIGSLLYLLHYMLNIAILEAVCKASFSTFSVVLGVIYIVAVLAVRVYVAIVR